MKMLFVLALLLTIASLGECRSARIIGGDTAVMGDAPYIVSVKHKTLFSTQHMCGGSIVNDNHIITTATCVQGSTKGNLAVAGGDLDLEHGEDSQENKNIKEIILHPDFDSNTKANDIAILKLTHNFVFVQDVIAAVTLPDPASEPEDGTPVSIAGWGYEAESGPQRESLWTNNLMTYQTNSACTIQDSSLVLSEMEACLAGPDGNGFCDGDEGGPVVDDAGVQVAMMSRFGGETCASTGVITPLAPYTQWILDHFDD